MEQLVVETRQVTERLENLLAEIARNRQALDWTGVTRTLDEVVSHPRDISNVIGLVRVAPALERFFQLHQLAMDTIAGCNESLRGLLREETAWDSFAFPLTRSQLLSAIRQVSESFDHLTAEVARAQEALHWNQLLSLVQNLKSNPRDLANVTNLARSASDLKKAFQLHQSVLDRVAESNELLRQNLSGVF